MGRRYSSWQLSPSKSFYQGSELSFSIDIRVPQIAVKRVERHSQTPGFRIDHAVFSAHCYPVIPKAQSSNSQSFSHLNALYAESWLSVKAPHINFLGSGTSGGCNCKRNGGISALSKAQSLLCDKDKYTALSVIWCDLKRSISDGGPKCIVNEEIDVTV